MTEDYQSNEIKSKIKKKTKNYVHSKGTIFTQWFIEFTQGYFIQHFSLQWMHSG